MKSLPNRLDQCQCPTSNAIHSHLPNYFTIATDNFHIYTDAVFSVGSIHREREYL